LRHKGPVTLPKISVKFCGQKRSFVYIVNSVTMSEAQFTQKLNQAAFCWST